MISKKILLLGLFCFGGILAFGQKTPDQPTSMEPVFPKTDYAPKVKAKKKPKKAGATYDARNNFYDRKEAQDKQRIKSEKSGSKPQYSDPEYFGHKRPPRKRATNKMKYCKVCGIRH
ncbi:MAG: hypothetical protein JJE09_04205 [Bacteroidia bacterium]|nr:hypothetical protein [Bacteroidia bacterium]